MDFEITRLSSKGQIVIPQSMRYGMKEGEKMILVRDGDRIILKRASKADENFKEDFEFAKRTEEAWKQIEKGECTTMDFDDFINEMKKW
ncbi:MAG: AbrB/MazE/SpoVT family DNA-binding domain-containing protein [Nanoarchaeota archaeon]|nr:AbrB/MazE/SpoVT family DNA-binding domain-containing protein [Nanoarchaeota archaeon]